MFQDLIQPIARTVSTLFLSLSILFGGAPTSAPISSAPAPVLGSTISAVADFQTSLASGISSTATTMTLASFVSGSESLTIGDTYGFKLGGREYVIGTAAASNQIINMVRGLSRKTGTTTVAAYQSAWGRATAVEMTDAPLILDLTNKANGVVGYENPLKYASSLATSTIASDAKNLVNVQLLNDTAFAGAGIVNASTVLKGSTEIATQIETASSTNLGGTGAVVVIPASYATSTYNSATAPLRVVVTQNSGKIDSNFIATSSLFNFTFAPGTRAIWVATSSRFFSVPTGLTSAIVECVAGGGGGGTGRGGGNTFGLGTGGGGGAYMKAAVNFTGTTSVGVVIGQGGAHGVTAGGGAQDGGNTIFGSYMTVNGGKGGGNLNGSTGLLASAGADGGTASTTATTTITTILSVPGGRGQVGFILSPSSNNIGIGSQGGSSFFGPGGTPGAYTGSSGGGAASTTAYGEGGGAGITANSINNSTVDGADGYQGICIVSY